MKNVSASAITLSSIASSGEFAATGSGTTKCVAGLLLNANKSCTLSVTFSPASGASGSISGAVVFSDTASVGQQIFDVKGTAALPLTFAPTSLTFAAQTVTITNNLSTSVSPVIAGNGDYAAVPGGTTPCTSTLAAKAKCTFAVTFTPSAVGTRASAVTVTDSANPAVQTLNVTGTGQ